MPKYIEFENREPMDLIGLFGRPRDGSIAAGLPSDLDLLLKMLTLNPAKRITASKALNHVYFSQDPAPCDPGELPVPGGESRANKRQKI